MSELFDRPEYLKELIRHRDSDLVKIVTGVRRCGKTSLLKLFARHLAESGVPASRVIHINLESPQNRDLSDCLSLYDYVRARVRGSGKTYLFLDEPQNVRHWERAVESFRLDFDADVYVALSDVSLFTSDHSIPFSGKYTEIRMLPLSFREFLSVHEFPPETSKEELFRKYIRTGGMPALRECLSDETRCDQILEGTYSVVVLRDVLRRNSRLDLDMLRKIVTFLCSNIGSVFSPNGIGGVLLDGGGVNGGNRKNVAGKTVEKYISALCDSFVFLHADRYDVKGGQPLRTLGKNYIVDTGFLGLLLDRQGEISVPVLENVVFLELVRRGYRVYIGKIGDRDIDFVAENPDGRLYVQVTDSILAPDSRERILRPLRMVRDNHEKIVLSMDRSYVKSYDGIRPVNLIDWLVS